MNMHYAMVLPPYILSLVCAELNFQIKTDIVLNKWAFSFVNIHFSIQKAAGNKMENRT